MTTPVDTTRDLTTAPPSLSLPNGVEAMSVLVASVPLLLGVACKRPAVVESAPAPVEDPLPLDGKPPYPIAPVDPPPAMVAEAPPELRQRATRLLEELDLRVQRGEGHLIYGCNVEDWVHLIDDPSAWVDELVRLGQEELTKRGTWDIRKTSFACRNFSVMTDCCRVSFTHLQYSVDRPHNSNPHSYTSYFSYGCRPAMPAEPGLKERVTGCINYLVTGSHVDWQYSHVPPLDIAIGLLQLVEAGAR